MMNITTEIRNYNSIENKQHFKTVRSNVNDHTKVKDAFLLINNKWTAIPDYLLKTL